MKFLKKIKDYFLNLPGRFKQSWEEYKIFAKATHSHNKEMMNKLMGVKKNE